MPCFWHESWREQPRPGHKEHPTGTAPPSVSRLGRWMQHHRRTGRLSRVCVLTLMAQFICGPALSCVSAWLMRPHFICLHGESAKHYVPREKKNQRQDVTLSSKKLASPANECKFCCWYTLDLLLGLVYGDPELICNDLKHAVLKREHTSHSLHLVRFLQTGTERRSVRRSWSKLPNRVDFVFRAVPFFLAGCFCRHGGWRLLILKP